MASRISPVSPENQSFSEESVSYEAAPVAEIQLDETDYRVDAGLGSAVAISSRETGTSTWSPVAHGKWDGLRLKARSLDHPVVSALERALKVAMSEQEGGFA
jgi:hypothetical protein